MLIKGEKVEQLFDPQVAPFPEKELLQGILQRTLADLCLDSSDCRKHRRSAYEWVMESSNEDDPFTFSYICFQLGFKPETVRNKMLEIYEFNKKSNKKFKYRTRINKSSL